MREQYKYLRVCCDCGDSKEVSYRPKKDTRCSSCSAKFKIAKNGHWNIKAEETKIRYKHTCPDCGDVRYKPTQHKTELCSKCSSRKNGKANYKEDKMRYFRICSECGDAKQVASQINGGIKLCKQCSNEKRKAESAKKPPKKRKNTYKPVGYDGRQKVKVKFQIVDEATMEAPVKKRKAKDIPQLTVEQDDAMTRAWLENNKVKEIA